MNDYCLHYSCPAVSLWTVFERRNVQGGSDKLHIHMFLSSGEHRYQLWSVTTSTSGQTILKKGCIAVLSPLAAANGFFQMFLGPKWLSLTNGISIGFEILYLQRLLMLFNGPDYPLNCPFPCGIPPRLIHGSFGSHSSAPKRHLDRFSCFCITRTWPPDRHTDQPCCSVCNSRSLCSSKLTLRFSLRILMIYWCSQ